MGNEDFNGESLKRILEEVNSSLRERYPLEKITLDDGRSLEVCLARIEGIASTRIEPGIRGDDLTFVEIRARVVKGGVGFGDEKRKVFLEVEHLGWSPVLDLEPLQKGDVLLVETDVEDPVEKSMVLILDSEPKFSIPDGFRELRAKPILGEESFDITDLRRGTGSIIGRVVRVDTSK